MRTRAYGDSRNTPAFPCAMAFALMPRSVRLVGMTLRDPDVAEPVITTRAQLRSSLGAHSRAPLADPGYTCFAKIKQRLCVATRHDWLPATASSNMHPFGFRHS